MMRNRKVVTESVRMVFSMLARRGYVRCNWGKWKGVIIYHLLNDTRRFNEFRRLVPGISQRMLTLQLRELENDGIIHREVYNVIPPKVEYSLTQFGQTLSNIIIQMREWGEIYAEQVQTQKRKHQYSYSRGI